MFTPLTFVQVDATRRLKTTGGSRLPAAEAADVRIH
ncbi:UNVERIFIED_ORG: hypothetical protein J2806_002623 [Kosakonia oryzae]|nr:hypothetical protein [Kosakonia oryzae]SKC21907.1 hypothetical protein SAMN05216168_4011 [Kosakonia radicincitans]VVT50293.1 hypothetical protein UYSO10_3245 [Kosakonia radicincitans]